MRNCPVCENASRLAIGNYQRGFTLYECDQCGMRYLDEEKASQAAMNEYYAADTSVDLQEKDSVDRLAALSAYLGEPQPGRPEIDVGGRWSPLAKMRPGMATLNAGEEMRGKYRLFVLSHTLEHVYDVRGLMDAIIAHALPGARLVIEGPYWKDYNDPAYDFYWQHCNKFLGVHYFGLLKHFGFAVTHAEELPAFREFLCCRYEGVLRA